MRSSYAYTPRPGPLQAASPGAAVAYLGSLVVVSFLYSSPLVLVALGAAAALAGLLAGARQAVRSALRMGFGLFLLIVAVNAIVGHRGQTVLARLGHWPWFGQVDVTAEALAEGAMIGLRAIVAIVAFAVYSACVDPDRVLRALRPLARHSALTATLISRLVPVAAADAARLGDAARLRGPGAAEVGRAPLARRLLAGSLDRAVDVAATLELRGYSLTAPRRRGRRFVLGRRGGVTPVQRASRFDRRFYLCGAAILIIGIVGKALGVGGSHIFPTTRVNVDAATLVLAAALALSGLAPWRRKPVRRAPALSRPLPVSAPRGAGAAPAPEVSRV
jgi:energy-coupling factor transport system permease protein